MFCNYTDKTSLIQLWQNCENNGDEADGFQRVVLKIAFWKGFVALVSGSPSCSGSLAVLLLCKMPLPLHGFVSVVVAPRLVFGNSFGDNISTAWCSS